MENPPVNPPQGVPGAPDAAEPPKPAVQPPSPNTPPPSCSYCSDKVPLNFDTWRAKDCSLLGGTFLLASVIMLVICGTWGLLGRYGNGDNWACTTAFRYVCAFGIVLGALAVCTFRKALVKLRIEYRIHQHKLEHEKAGNASPNQNLDESKRAISNKTRFSQAVAGVGFAMLLDGVATLTALSTIAGIGLLDQILGTPVCAISATAQALTNNSAIQGPADAAGTTPQLPPKEGKKEDKPKTPEAPKDPAKPDAPRQEEGKADVSTKDNATEGTPKPGDLKPRTASAPVASKCKTLLKAARDSAVAATRIILILAFAIFGALFYFATSMWEKSSGPEELTERFDINIFWGGLWFRLGEAVIFGLVAYLLFNSGKEPISGCALLLIVLFFGMFLKAAEGVIVGLSDRTFAAIGQFVPLAAPKAVKEMATVGLKLEKKEGKLPEPAELKRLADSLQKAMPGIERYGLTESTGEIRILYDSKRHMPSDFVKHLFIEGWNVML